MATTRRKYRRVKSAFQPPMVGGSVPVFKAKLDANALEAGKAGRTRHHLLDLARTATPEVHRRKSRATGSTTTSTTQGVGKRR